MIRNAAMADLPSLAEIFRQLHLHHVNIAPDNNRMPFEQYFELEMKSFLEDDDIVILVSETDEINAYVAFRIIDRGEPVSVPARILYVEHFAVAENVRRSGVGTALFNAIKEYAAERECDKIQLGAAAANTSALSFYESVGMKPRTIKLELKL